MKTPFCITYKNACEIANWLEENYSELIPYQDDDIYEIQTKQQYLREKMEENELYKRYMFHHKSNSICKIRVGIFTTLLQTHRNDYDNFDEFEFNVKTHNTNDDIDDDKKNTFKCCCHQDSRLFIVNLVGSERIISVGTSCIKRFMSKIDKSVNHQLNELLKRNCHMCGLKKVLPNSKFDDCKECLKIKKENRKCDICEKYKIPMKNDIKHNKCYDCYKTDMRKCIQCNRLTIPNDKPNYVLRCYRCYYGR